MSRRLIALLLVGTSILAACAAPDEGGRHAANVRLTVVAGPVCPVETMPPDPACAPRPLPGAELVVTAADGATRTLVAGGDGVAAGVLEPGRYTVTPGAVAGVLGTAAPFELEIADPAALVEQDVIYDTGIR